MYELVVTGTPQEAAAEAARRTAAALEEARRARGAAHVALAGGRTPRRAYEALAPMLSDWRDVHLWFGDERCVPADDPESNFRLVSESLLAGATVPAEQVHRVAVERPPAEAAARYAGDLRRAVPAGPDGIPRLDLVFLGLGEDGHTASLFPGDPEIGVSTALCRAVRAPKPPPDRVTLTLGVLRAARTALVLATGEGKAWALGQALAGPNPGIPASLLPPLTTVVIADSAAAGARVAG